MNELLDLVKYNEWANARLVAVVRRLPDAAFSAPIVSSFESVRQTLAHIVSAEWIWLRRWKGESPTALPAWVAEGGRTELLDRLEDLQAERAVFLAGLSECRFGELVGYRAISGDSFTHTLADQIRHVVNHSTYHRGQAATQLRQLGLVPPSTDFLVYRRETA